VARRRIADPHATGAQRFLAFEFAAETDQMAAVVERLAVDHVEHALRARRDGQQRREPGVTAAGGQTPGAQRTTATSLLGT
jgi:hypothetical protein